MTLDAERWRRLRPLLDAVLDRDAAGRDELLAEVAADTPDLHDDLVRLLGEHLRLAQQPFRQAGELVAPFVSMALEDEALVDAARVGQVVGPYRLVRLVGAGGMGAVYLAERTSGEFGQRVALKVVRAALGGAGERARFDRERRVLAGLSHPNIAALYDGGQTADGQAFYTMEYVDGAAITDFCRVDAVDVGARVRLLIQVAAGLAHAHQNLVVHRDIKPSNVMVTADRRAKLVDFGIAKPIGEGAGTALTDDAGGPMTPEYAAPEQFRRLPATVATDIYQFGVLCYRVLSGRLPYRADPRDALAWARAVIEQEASPLDRATTAAGGAAPSDVAGRSRLRIDRDLDAVVRKAMAKSPEQRYRSMDALIGDLESWLVGRPVSARRAGSLYFARRFVARHPYASTASMFAVAALLLTALVAVQQARSAHREAARAEAVANFLVDLFQVSDPGRNRGERLSANQILERGAERIDRELADEPGQRARLLAIIGKVYSALGDFPRARGPLERAVAAYRAVPGSDPREAAVAVHSLANVALREGKPDEALLLLGDEDALLDDSPSTRASRAKMLQARGSALRQQGKLHDAKAAMQSARAIALDSADATGETLHQVDTALGLLQNDLREYRDAHANLEEALAASRRAYPEGDYRIATAAFNLGLVKMNLSDLAGAAALMEPAIERVRAQFGADDYRYAIMMNTLGGLARQQRNFALALTRYDESDRAFVAAFGDAYTERAWPLVNGARVLIEQGDYAAALARTERALAIRRAKLGDDHPEVAHSWDAMAEALLALGRFAEARDYAARALPVLRAKLPADHDAIVECLLHLGLAEYALGDEADARTLWHEARERAPRVFAPRSVDMQELQAAIAEPDVALHRR